MNLLHPRIQDYLLNLLPSTPDYFRYFEQVESDKVSLSIGPQAGYFLFQLAKLISAKNIFEFGSAFGYSALWLASALPLNGKIICTDFDQSNAEIAQKVFTNAGIEKKLCFELGNALEIFNKYQGPFDLIFCDLNKIYYPEVLKIALPKLKIGGLFVADNVLWSGWVVDPHENSADTVAIREFNQSIFNNPNLVSSIIPIRDGMSVSLKTS